MYRLLSSFLVIIVGPLLSTKTHAFVFPRTTTSLPTTTVTTTTQLHLYESVEAAIVEAQRVCAADPASHECRVAWDIVEELEAADSHKAGRSRVAAAAEIAPPPPAVGMDGDAMMGSFDILLTKIDGKMDQLYATAESLQEMDPEAMQELALAAQQMKQTIEGTRARWNM